jgi:hypothetical protein
MYICSNVLIKGVKISGEQKPGEINKWVRSMTKVGNGGGSYVQRIDSSSTKNKLY